MLLTSWIRALRQSFTRRRFSRPRRQQADARRQPGRHARMVEILEERSLLSIKALVIDINQLTGNNVFTSSASTPGINITNSMLDANNDGISDYDTLVIGASQSSTFDSTLISGAGIGIRIDLSNLTGLNHIVIDNVNITAGTNQQGISVTLDNVALQSLAVDQTNVTPAANGTGGTGLDINLKNMSSTTGVDVSIQNSNIRSGSPNFSGVNVSLESVSKGTHVGHLTLADSIVEGLAVTSSANSILYASIDQASARNNRIQDGAANPVARGITYNLNRTSVGDLRIENNLRLRNVAVTTTDSPLKAVSISDNSNLNNPNGGFDVSSFVATDTIRDAIRLNAISTDAVGTLRSDVTNLRIVNNTITGSLVNTNSVNGITLSMRDANLGDHTVPYAGARIAGNTISNLSGSAANPATAISITATASSNFVTGNGGQPLRLDLKGDGSANDVNGIVGNTISNNNGRGLVVATQKDTNFLADVTGNNINGGSAPNRSSAVLMTFTDKPTLASADSFALNFSSNTISNSRGAAVGLAMQDTAVGSFVVSDNEITNTVDSPAGAANSVFSTPNAFTVVMQGTNGNQEATNLLKASVIQNNYIGITRPTAANPNSAAPNNASGIFIDSQEASTIQDMQILNNVLRNNGTNNTRAGLQFLREDKSVLSSSNPSARAVTISGNTIGENRNGILLDARNGSIDLSDFAVSNNFVGVDATGADIGNIDDGINLRVEADARLLADLTNNQIRFNNGNGINLNDVFGNFSSDKRQVGGTWINNTISDNSQNGVLITGRHGLSDEVTGVTTPLVIGQEGQGNLIANNGASGIQIFGRVAVNTPQGILDRATATGTISITDNTVRSNASTGIFAESANEQIDIRHNQIEANIGKGIDLHVIHGIPTLPTNNGLPGILSATIRDNVVTGQRNTDANTFDGDGIQITGFELVRARLGALQEDNASLNLLNASILNNFVDSNAGRGIDILNVGAGTMQLKIGDGTNAARNTIIGNQLDGIRVVNSGERGQINLLDGVPTGANPLGVTHDIVSRDAAFAPDIMLDVSRNTIRDNGIGLPASIQTGGVSQVNGSGLVLLAGAVGQGADAVGTGFDFFPNEVGANSGDPLAGNGRINLRVTNNEFEGNFGNDFVVAPYIATIAPPTTGVWDTTNYAFSMFFDPLIRVNAVVTGNTGNGIDVIRPAPDYITDESVFKSRLRVLAPSGPFGSGTRPRDATRLAVDGNPVSPALGFRFVYPGIDERAYGPQTGDASLQINNSFINIGPPASSVNISPTTLRVEAGFDRSGKTQGFAFYSPSSPGPGSDDNFDDTAVAINTGTLRIVNGREDVLWDTVQQSTFSYPNVDFPTFVTPSVSNFPTLGNTSPGTVTVNFSEFVQFVDISDFRLLRNGLPVSFAGLAVTPVNSSQDPNHAGAFKSYTLNLTSVTSLAGDYQFQVLAVDSSNPVFTAIRDVHLQFNNQGNPLQRVTDGAGVLQDYALNYLFTVDSSRPIATISPVTPNLRNAAAGIVAINFNEPVTGVDISDFELYRTVGGSTVPVNLGSVTVTQMSSTQYTLNINQLTGAPGDYDLRLVSTDKSTPILDAALNPIFEPTSASLQSDISASDLQVTLTSASGFPTSASPLSPFVIDVAGEQMLVTGMTGTTFDVSRGYNGTTSASHLASSTVTLKISSEDTWTVDSTLPFVTSIADSLITTTIASPINANPASVIVNFSENVLGVDISDFSLARTNADGTMTLIDLSGSPLFSLSAHQYELNLSALPAIAGTYQLTINPLNSGITDLAGNAFLTRFSTSWVLDVTSPLADIVDVTPDPRQTPVDGLNTLFTEKVSGVNTADASAQYVLAFDDGTAATAAAINDATNAGPIVVTSAGHGLANGDRITVYGVQGNTNANGVFTVQNTTANTFELSGSSGSGIYTGGGRWVRTVSLAGLTILQQSDTRYELNLSTVTLNQGTYIVSLLANSGITDVAGNAVGPTAGQFNVASQEVWTNGPDVAPTGAITPITTPRGTNAGVVTVTFSEPLAKINNNSPVDYKDFKLTRGATTIPLNNVPITQTGPTTYTLDLSASGLTDVDGTYTLQLLNTDTSGSSATPLKDLTGNLLSDDSDPLTPAGVASQVVWVKSSALSGPQVTSFIDEQRGNTLGSITKLRPVQTLTINFSDLVTGIDLTDASKNFLLTRQATGGVPIPVSLEGFAVQQVTASQYRISLSSLTGTDGTYRFTVLANGLITNTASVPVELKNPQTVIWVKDGTMRPSATAADSTDSNPGNEVVGTGSNYSLRQAIQEANALPGDDVIELGAGTYSLSLTGVQEDFAALGDLDIRDNLVIRGKGVGTTIIDATALSNPSLSPTFRDRLFQILAGVTVTIQGVTIQKGAVTGSEDGGAIRNAGNLTILDALIQNNTSQDNAGAINNTGTLTINRTTISGNTTTLAGGAIRNAGTLLINNSTLSNNVTTAAGGNGGALMNVATFSATLENTTVSANTAQNAAGGGIRNDGSLRLINDTIAFNRSLTVGAGISRNLGTVTIGNTIVSDNKLTNAAATASDVAGTFASIGGNLVRTPGTAIGFIGTDQLNVNPNLLTLGSYGGPTQTHALPAFDATGAQNPAIDRGLNANVTNQDPTTSFDQRGGLRFLDGPNTGNSVDVGAFEFGTFFVNTTDDSIDVKPGDGLAEDGLRQTSLRAAIMESNALAGESAIILNGQVYSLKRLAPLADSTKPVVASIIGVPLAPITTGGVGEVTITFSQRVAGVDLTDIVLTRTVGAVVTPIVLSPNVFQITKVSDTVYKIQNKADIVNNVLINSGLTSVTQTNGLYNLTVLTTSPTALDANGLPLRIRDIEDRTLVATANVNWVRGVDTFAPTVTMRANSNNVALNQQSDFITNAGNVTVTFSEKVTGVSANNFTLTRNGTAVPGLVVTPVTDNNFAGRTTVLLNLQALTAGYGNYVLTLNPNVGANVTIKDTASNNLAAGASINWTKTAGVQFEPINSPRVDEVTKVRVQFTEKVAGLKLDDFTLTYDDGSGIGPQLVDLSQATLTPVGTLVAVPNFGNAADQWDVTFSNKQAARDGVYSLSFDGLTNGNQLVTTATTAITVVPFVPTAATLPFQIGENQAKLGDLNIVVGAGRVQIFGKGKDDSTTVLGNPQPRTVIDGNLTDRLFDLSVGANLAISGVEMINGKVAYERSGGAFRNLGTLTINDSDVGTTNGTAVQGNFADGNGGAIDNAAPAAPVSAVLQANINANVVTLTVDSVASFPTTVPFTILVDSEQMQVTAVNVATNQFTVLRGFAGTTPAAHLANATVTLIAARVGIAGSLQQPALVGDVVLSLASVAAFPNTAPFLVLIDSEQILVTGVNTATNQFTVSRGFNGTTATAHAANSVVTLQSLTTINRSNLQNNLAGSATSGSQYGKGGAIFNENGAVRINEGTYSSNAAVTDGGAIYNGNNTTASLQSTSFTNNNSGRDGGAIYNNDTAIMTISASTLSNNKADAVVSGIANDLNGNGGAIFNETSAKLVLDDSLLQNNSAQNGGALYNDDGTLVLNRDTFGVNSALQNGGAIVNTSGGSLTLNQGLFTTNSASDNGGAIQNFGTLVVADVFGAGTQFLSNEAGTDFRPGDSNKGDGGAIFNRDGKVDIHSATFTLNRSHGNAGVIFNDGVGILTLQRTTFDRNSAESKGGVLVNNDSAQTTINEVTFSNNTATGDGGAIENNSQFTSGSTLALTIDNTTLNNNSAARGGAIFNSSLGGMTMTNSTLSANVASTNGGGLANFGTVSLLNDTLYLNNAPIGAGIANNIGGIQPFAPLNFRNTLVAGSTSGPDISGDNFVNGGHNLIQTVGTITAFLANGTPTTIANGDGNGDIVGANPQLDTLRDNGGPTLTHGLLFGSPARDAGDNFGVTLNDQRGLNRVFDGDGNGVATVDIGSYESGFVVNSFLDTVDQNPGDGINADKNGQSTLRAAIMEANARPGEDTIILGPGIFKLTLPGRHEDFRLNSAGNVQSSSETGDLDILGDLNIIGAGANLTFIDAAQIDRLFQVFPGVSLKLSNMTLQNGDATSTDFGGAIYNQGSTTLTNVVVINSSAGRGGGIYNDTTGTLTINNSLFRGNQAVQQGGAIYNDGTLTLNHSDIGAASRLAAAVSSAVATTVMLSDVSNFPTSGPFVIQVDAERMLVTSILGSVFTVTRGDNGTVATSHAATAFATLGNVANIHGGGLFNLGVAKITQSSFSGNLAQSRGGGLYNAAITGALTAAITAVQPTITLTQVTGFPTSGTFTIQVDSEMMLVTSVNFLTNTLNVQRGANGTQQAVHVAGAFATSVDVNQATISQSTFLDNFASSRGAAIYNEEKLTIENSTLSNNDSGTNAALGNSVSGRVTIENSTVVDNVAYRGGGLANSLVGTVTVHNTIVANNASTSISGAKAPNVRGIFATQGNNFIGNNADSAGFTNNTNFDQVGSGTSPFDPVLKALADNGGPTLTYAARTGSPIINNGNNTGGTPVDQRGAIRPTNNTSDIGAVEQQNVHVTINDVALKEGNSGSTIFTFTLSLNNPSIQEVRVHYTLQGDTAFPGQDFIDSSGDVVFAPNQLTQILQVVVNGDTTIEPDEQFFVNLSIPANAAFTPILDRTQAVGTILSDDTGFRITDVNKVEGALGSPDQSYVFAVSVVGAKLAPGQMVNVNYSIVDGTATIADNDYALVGASTGTFTFTAGPNGELPAAQTITVMVKGDNKVEPNEKFFVNLTSTDLPFEFGKNKGVGTIFNDNLGFNVSNASTLEGNPPNLTPMNFVVSLQQPVYVAGVGGVPTLATTTAVLSTASGTATSGQDFQPINGQVLTFSGATTSQIVPVQVIGDLRYEVIPAGSLQTGVLVGDTTLMLNSVAALPTNVPYPIIVDAEVMQVTAVDPSTNQLTVTRGFVGTTPAGHSIGATVSKYETFQLQVTGGTINGVSDTNVIGLSNAGTGSIIDDDPPPDQWHIYIDSVTSHLKVDLIRFAQPTLTLVDTTDHTTALSLVGDFTGAPTDDLFNVDFANGNPIPTSGLSVDGRNQVGADTVQFNNGAFSTVTYNSINSGTGSVNFDGSIVNYTGLEPIVDNTTADNRIFNAPVGVTNDSIAVSASSGVISISGTTFESVTALAPASSLVINGNSGNNSIQVNSSDLTFTAGLTVNAGDGNDTVNLTGWALPSTIIGGNGDDTITGGSGNDSIDGGAGNDSISSGLGNDTILGGFGDDTIVLGGGNDLANGGDGNDSISTSVTSNGANTIFGGNGNDTLVGGLGNDVIVGDSGDDSISGISGNDTLLGGDGNDIIVGGLGNDSIAGGFGDDTMYAGVGSDTVDGQNGSDVVAFNAFSTNVTLTSTLLTTSAGTATIINAERAYLSPLSVSGTDNHKIDASTFAGSVTMIGEGGNDTLLGGLGDDSIVGGAGNDLISGNNGNDTISGGDGNDTITGNAGDDSISGDGGADSIDGGAGNDYISGGAGNDSLIGGAGNDTLDGGDGNDTLSGGDGNDSLLGGAGQDSIHGDSGDDTIDGGAGDDTCFGDDGNDYVGGGAGNDSLSGGNGNDSVNGNDGNDTCDGNAGFNTLFGGNGDDSLISNFGNDQILGQGGKDSFTFNGDPTTANIFTITATTNGNPGSTEVGIGLARLNPANAFTTVLLGVEIFTLNLGTGNDLVTLGDLSSVTDISVLNINAGDGNDTVDGSLSTGAAVALRLNMGAGNDSVQGTGAGDTVDGGAGNDTIIGNAGNDSLNGSAGNDSLNGNDGNDTINGGLGNDSIWGGGGADSLLGSDGNDTIWGQGGNDTIDGGLGDDSLDGGYGNSLTTGTGDDLIIGGWGNDKIAGRDGNDTIYGDSPTDSLASGNDTILGGDGSDKIDAGNGDDLVDGGDGNDTINGGAGNDTLLGGTGDDSILGGSGNDILVGGAGNDTLDGQGGNNILVGGNGTGADSHSAGDIRKRGIINELFKLTTARPSIFGELNF